MKKMMTIAMTAIMMVIGTATMNGKTNTRPAMNNRPHTEVIVVSNNHGVMPHHAVRPIPHHIHKFNRHHTCRICHLTEREIIRMERMKHHNTHHPAPAPVPPRRH